MKLSFNDDGPGPVVVLLHGFPLDRTMWSHQRSSVGSIYRLITPDLRGHGESAAPDGIYQVDEMADDVIALLDDLQLRQPVVIGGLSMGGYVALSMALHFPDRVKGMILLNSRAAADLPEASKARQATADQIEITGETDTFLDGMVPKLFSGKTLKNHPELVHHWRARMAKIPARTIVGTLRGLATRPDRRKSLANLNMPTLIVAGEHDQIVPLDEAQQMASMIPDARLTIVQEAGHLSPVENPSATSKALLDFLNELHGTY